MGGAWGGLAAAATYCYLWSSKTQPFPKGLDLTGIIVTRVCEMRQWRSLKELDIDAGDSSSAATHSEDDDFVAKTFLDETNHRLKIFLRILFGILGVPLMALFSVAPCVHAVAKGHTTMGVLFAVRGAWLLSLVISSTMLVSQLFSAHNL